MEEENPPKLVLSPEELRIKSRSFVNTVQEFRTKVLKKERDNSLIPFVLKTKVIDDAKAKTHIESISDFEPIINKRKNAESADYIVKLIDFQNYEQNKAIRNYFERIMNNMGHKVIRTNYTPSHVVYNVKGVNHDELMTLNKNEIFEAIFPSNLCPDIQLLLIWKKMKQQLTF